MFSDAADKQHRLVTKWRKSNPGPLQRHGVVLRKGDLGLEGQMAVLEMIRLMHADKFGFISHSITREKRDTGDLLVLMYCPEKRKRFA